MNNTVTYTHYSAAMGAMAEIGCTPTEINFVERNADRGEAISIIRHSDSAVVRFVNHYGVEVELETKVMEGV